MVLNTVNRSSVSMNTDESQAMRAWARPWQFAVTWHSRRARAAPSKVSSGLPSPKFDDAERHRRFAVEHGGAGASLGGSTESRRGQGHGMRTG